MNKAAIERYFVLFFPYALSLFFSSDPVFSYGIAWLGSFFIFLVTLTGWVKPLPTDLSFAEQIMRPIILVHIIFAGYMCCTSVFYLLNALGYEYFTKPNPYFLVDQKRIEAIAQCQRYYCLGHAAFVTGILMVMRYPEKQKIVYEKSSITNLLFWAAIGTFPLSIVFLTVPGLSQFANQFTSLSFIAGTLALAFAIPQKKAINTLICTALYLFNFYAALTSGFKEPILISVLVLGIFLYPSYKKVVLVVFTPIIFLLFLVLPTYAKIFRQNAWAGNVAADEATQLALDAALNNSDDDEVDDTNWTFLTNRLSEIDMFTLFVQSTPDKIDYYGTKLLEQSAIALVPRIFWPTKPITEELVMERVYTAGVVNRNAKVSAKPSFIVDAYLSGGTFSVFVCLFLYGATAQFISQKAEELFGGYLLGTALIFSGLFQIMWRGLSFEFIFNAVFWSYITMILLHKFLKAKNILQDA